MPDTKSMTTLLSTKGQKVLCLNIRSIYANHSQIEADFAGTNITALCLTETWLKPILKSHVINIEGFQLIRNDRLINKRGGGVAIYLRKDLTWSYLKLDLNKSTPDIEILSVIIDRNFQPNLCISVIYIPPTANIQEAIKHMDCIAEEIAKENLHWILCGDLNVDLKDKKLPKPLRQLNKFSSRNLLTQLIKTPTRKTPTSASLIDHIYTNIDSSMTTSDVITYGVSDHDLIYIIVKKETLLPKSIESFTCRKMTQYTIDLLDYYLNTADWSEFLNMPNVDVGWSLLYSMFTRALSITAPFIIMRGVKSRQVWTSSELLELIRLRDAEKEKVDSLCSNDSYTEYKKLRNKVKRKIIKDKRNHIRFKIDSTSNNTKKYWKEINSLFKPSVSTDANIKLNRDNVELTDNEIPNYMNT